MQPSFALASSGKETAITAVRIIAAAGLLSHLRFSSALGRSHRLSPRAKLCAVSTVPYRRPAVTSAPPGAPPPRLARPFTASVQCAQPPSGLAPHPKHLCGKMRHAARRRGIWCSRSICISATDSACHARMLTLYLTGRQTPQQEDS